MAKRPIPKIKVGQKRLTKEQEAYLKVFAKKQIERYLSTKQVLSDEKLELCVRNAYKVAGLDLPKKIRWVDSPKALTDKRDSVWASVRASVWASVWASMGASVWAYYDSADLSFYKFFHENFRPNKLVGLQKLSENVMGYGFYEKECWLMRKPIVLTLDEGGRLHNETGVAIQWADGYGFYFWHGVRATEKIVKTPEKLTKRDWVKEENLEVRRVIQDRMPDFVKKIGGKKISSDEVGELWEVELPNDEEKIARYAKVKDTSTERVYWIRVSPATTTAREGIAWSFGVEAKDYVLEEET